MISAAMEPTAPPSARAPAPRAGAKGREGAAFDEALRDQESATLDTEKDDPLATSDAEPAPAAAPPPAPVALDALIAQVLPPPQQQPPQSMPQEPTQEQPQQPSPDVQALPLDERRATPLLHAANPPRASKNGDDGDESAPDLVVDAPDEPHRPEAPNTPGQTFRADKEDADAQDAPSRGASAFTPAADAKAQGDANGRKVGQDESSAPQVRSVAVRKVETSNHFPVTVDPVRQIAAHVTRALDAPAAPSPALADAQSQPVKTISVTLEPESLGTVTLRMRLSGNHLSVRVDVAEPATLELLQRDRDRLQKSMTSDNVSIDRLEIHAAREAPAVQGGDNANAPKQDMNAPGQQPRHNHASPGGEQRGGSRSQQQQQSSQQQTRMNGQDNDSPRGSDSRNLYL